MHSTFARKLLASEDDWTKITISEFNLLLFVITKFLGIYILHTSSPYDAAHDLINLEEEFLK